MKKLVISLLLVCFALYASISFADGTQLHKVTWKGKQWEYLAEYPSDIQHVDTARFEEIMDTAGQHGWRLVTVSHAFHFYVFYFTRPLLPEKLVKHRARLKKIKDARAAKESAQLKQIKAAHLERLKVEEQTERQLEEINKELKEEIQLEKQVEKK